MLGWGWGWGVEQEGKGHVRGEDYRVLLPDVFFPSLSWCVYFTASICTDYLMQTLGRCFKWATQILAATVFLSGGTPANHTLYERETGEKQRAIHLSWPYSIVPMCSYYNGPKLCMTLCHFLPFKSCFWESTAVVQTAVRTCAGAAAAGCGSRQVRHGLVPNI